MTNTKREDVNLTGALIDFQVAILKEIPDIKFKQTTYSSSGKILEREDQMDAFLDEKKVGKISVNTQRVSEYGPANYQVLYTVEGPRIPRTKRRTNWYHSLNTRDSIHIKSLMKFVKLGFRPDNQRELFEAARKADAELRRIKYELHDLDQIDKEAFMGDIYNTTINLEQLKEILFEAYGMVAQTERTSTLKQRLMDHPVKRAALQQEYNNRLGDIALQFDLEDQS
jgi:hypothetical protein